VAALPLFPPQAGKNKIYQINNQRKVPLIVAALPLFPPQAGKNKIYQINNQRKVPLIHEV
jgi:hypothetical protein